MNKTIKTVLIVIILLIVIGAALLIVSAYVKDYQARVDRDIIEQDQNDILKDMQRNPSKYFEDP